MPILRNCSVEVNLLGSGKGEKSICVVSSQKFFSLELKVDNFWVNKVMGG